MSTVPDASKEAPGKAITSSAPTTKPEPDDDQEPLKRDDPDYWLKLAKRSS